MQLIFNIENDIAVLKDTNLGPDYYLDSFLEVFIQDMNKEFSFFSTTMHSTILIALCDLLTQLHPNGEKQILDTFGNSNTYTFEISNNDIIITNFDHFSHEEEWKHSFNFFEFTVAYTAELRNYLTTMKNVDIHIEKHSSYKLLSEKLILLEKIIN
ncbi:hypothetical protein [Metasolibacillus sp.]|uniref:hypothetical protein n=1 Tax=Metasolibacillus sp. TaxID=2703680 RepID=UPI0025FDBD83|nr:hypothetical protein [Metasolibacillus sp.]MCT6926068.1 hypothetical protein [Metasolibacillus sp.]MCT6942212.1 hypothetical protein [Metasolibacillus sp.]